jgi:hypothetical protein
MFDWGLLENHPGARPAGKGNLGADQASDQARHRFSRLKFNDSLLGYQFRQQMETTNLGDRGLQTAGTLRAPGRS